MPVPVVHLDGHVVEVAAVAPFDVHVRAVAVVADCWWWPTDSSSSSLNAAAVAAVDVAIDAAESVAPYPSLPAVAEVIPSDE